MQKPIAFYDTECFPNYWLLKFRPRGAEATTFALMAGQQFFGHEVNEISDLFSRYTTVSFNGNGYDAPMISAALCGYKCEELKARNDQIIVEGMKPWHFSDQWKPADHIDIMEVAPGAGSQKVYAGRIHCKTMRDLPYSPNEALSFEQIVQVAEYCENDLTVLEALFDALAPQNEQRAELSKRYGIDLRSKSDAQLAEAVLKHRCEQVLGSRRYKPEIDWNMQFRYEAPAWLSFTTPQLQQVFETVKRSWFYLGEKGTVEMPAELRNLEVRIGNSTYRMGIGGLHSSEKHQVVCSSDTHIIVSPDVVSYYPNMMLNSGKWPRALGEAFLQEYAAIKDERLAAKKLQKTLTKGTPEWTAAMVGNEGGKIMINGTFGKTGSPYSILFAPEMMIQTTVTGQLALLMLVEWLEGHGHQVVSANTDGIVILCSKEYVNHVKSILDIWERRTGLEMETSEYSAIYSRDVNNYFAVKSDGSVKRKGEYSTAGLVEKKNPDVEICGDAVAEFLSKGTPLLYTIVMCRDIRKFVSVQKVTGGAVKMWGDGPRKDALVRDMVPVLEANGWVKQGRNWNRSAHDGYQVTAEVASNARAAYELCFPPQRLEPLGKVIRWFYSTDAPGPIVYAKNGNTVGNSWGAKPCMVLPDEFPEDLDYKWYLAKCEQILKDVGWTQ